MSFNATIAIDTTVKGRKWYPFAACNRLWLPKYVVRGGTWQSNPASDVVLGIQVNDQGQDMHPWSIQDGFVNSASGPMAGIWVTVLTRGTADTVYLCTGTNVGMAYGNEDGLSPVVGDGAGTQGQTQPHHIL